MSRQLAVPYFPAPPTQYDPRYFMDIVNSFSSFAQQTQVPGEGRNTFGVYTALPESDVGLETGTLYRSGNQVLIAVPNVAAVAGLAVAARVGVAVVVRDETVALAGLSSPVVVGTPAAVPSIDAPVGTLAVSADVGAVDVLTNTAVLSGIGFTAAVGSPQVITNVATPGGVFVGAEVGGVVVSIPETVAPSGVALVSAMGSVAVENLLLVALTGLSSAAGLGSTTFTTSTTVVAHKFSAQTRVGAVYVSGAAPTGVSMSAQLGAPTIATT